MEIVTVRLLLKNKWKQNLAPKQNNAGESRSTENCKIDWNLTIEINSICIKLNMFLKNKKKTLSGATKSSLIIIKKKDFFLGISFGYRIKYKS